MRYGIYKKRVLKCLEVIAFCVRTAVHVKQSVTKTLSVTRLIIYYKHDLDAACVLCMPKLFNFYLVNSVYIDSE